MQNCIMQAYLLRSDTQMHGYLSSERLRPAVTSEACPPTAHFSHKPHILRRNYRVAVPGWFVHFLLCVAAPRRWPWKSAWMNARRPWTSSSTTTSARAWRGCGQGNRSVPQPRGFPLRFTRSVLWVAGETAATSVVGPWLVDSPNLHCLCRSGT